MEYRPPIDGLRALAVIFVILFHCFKDQFPGGYIGVDVFFGISGYLITSIFLHDLQHPGFKLRTFFYRRALRILPAFLVVGLATLPLAYWVLNAEDFKRNAHELLAACGLIFNFIPAGEPQPPPDPNRRLYLHYWSLSVEEQFYLAWPILVWAGVKIKNRWGSNPWLWVYGPIGVASLAIYIVWARQMSPASYFHTASRIWQIIAGCALGAAEFYGWPLGWLRIRVLMPLAMIWLMAEMLYIHDIYPYIRAPFATLATCAILARSAESHWINSVLASPVVAYIGRISYPLYLWHWPLLALAGVQWGMPWKPGVILACVALTFVLSALTYALVELPAKRVSQALRSELDQ